MKKSLRFLTAALAAGAIVTGTMFTSSAYAEDKTTVSASTIDERPHFDTSGYVVINGLQFHKISDTTVEVSKGMDFNTSKIEIPSSISVDDVRFTVTTIGAKAFKNENNDGKVYAAKSITIPTSVTKVNSLCFYDLVNIESLDLSFIPEYYYYSTNLISRDALNMNSIAKLDRVKVSMCYLKESSNYPSWTYKVFTNADFSPITFSDEQGKVMSTWYIKSNVRINELQDPLAKEGYTFSGWKSETVKTPSGEKVTYIKYTPIYEKGQPLWNAEDKIKSKLNNLAVNEETKQSEIVKLIQSCLTFDNISYSVDNFRIVPSQEQVRGALRCTINLINKNNNEKVSIEVDKYLTELPEAIKVKPLVDEYEYTESTSENDIIDYLKGKLDDIGLDIKVENFNNNKRHVRGNIVITNKLDGLHRKFELNKVVDKNIKSVVEDAISNLKINSKTKVDSVQSQITKYIGDDRYEVSIIDYENANGKITGTVMVKDKSGTNTIVDLNESVQLRSQSLEDAFKIVQANLEKFNPTDNTTESDAISFLSNGIKDSGIEVTIPDFRNNNGQVKGTVTLYDVDKEESKTLKLNKTTIEGVIKLNIDNIKTNKNTTLDDFYKMLRERYGDDADFEISDFKNIDGHITATIIIHENGKDDVEIKVDKISVSQTVQEAVDIINSNLTDYVPTNSTSGSQVIVAITKGIKDPDISVTIPDFSNNGQLVKGTIKISKKGENGAEIKLEKQTAMTGGSGSQGQGTEETGGNTSTGGSGSGSGSSTGSGSGNGSGSGTSIPSTGATTSNNSSTSSSGSSSSTMTGGNNTNSTGSNTSTTTNTASTGNNTNNMTTGNNTNTNTTTTGSNSNTNNNTTGNNSVSLDNLSISGGGSTSSTGAITLNPNIGSTTVTNGNTTVSTPVNLTFNLNGLDLLNSAKKDTTTTTTTTTTNGTLNENQTQDELFKLLLYKYLQGLK